ncbi:hypothetical protein TIFTF001_051799 [Ficus carica]|uniref:Uncharacterized protein n=1 Tax=Ficus carica TaxID=3494 RepID=A0AA88JGA8_FICCA|nr:hypothetical protein TIFTF001_051799 [Ficus carica]
MSGPHHTVARRPPRAARGAKRRTGAPRHPILAPRGTGAPHGRKGRQRSRAPGAPQVPPTGARRLTRPPKSTGATGAMRGLHGHRPF